MVLVLIVVVVMVVVVVVVLVVVVVMILLLDGMILLLTVTVFLNHQGFQATVMSSQVLPLLLPCTFPLALSLAQFRRIISYQRALEEFLLCS